MLWHVPPKQHVPPPTSRRSNDRKMGAPYNLPCGYSWLLLILQPLPLNDQSHTGIHLKLLQQHCSYDWPWQSVGAKTLGNLHQSDSLPERRYRCILSMLLNISCRFIFLFYLLHATTDEAYWHEYN